MAPNNLDDAPDWAVDFMKNVPTTWDEVKFIDGYPGKYIVMARKSGDNWYVAAINAEEDPLITEIELPGLKVGKQISMYTDDKDLNGSLKTVKADKKGKVSLTSPKTAQHSSNIKIRALKTLKVFSAPISTKDLKNRLI